jgi:hypothetical protein
VSDGAAPDGVHDLLAVGGRPGADWLTTTIPGSSPPVSLQRLHLHRGTKASLSLVRFPAGWARPGVGHYDVGEEFAVLSGVLEVSGIAHRPGDVVYLAPGTRRRDSAAADGVLALAWFSGPPQWHTEPDDGCVELPGGYAGPPAAGPLRTASAEVGGGSELADPSPGAPAGTDRDILWLQGTRWTFVPAGAQPPRLPGPALVRTWP